MTRQFVSVEHAVRDVLEAYEYLATYQLNVTRWMFTTRLHVVEIAVYVREEFADTDWRAILHTALERVVSDDALDESLAVARALGAPASALYALVWSDTP